MSAVGYDVQDARPDGLPGLRTAWLGIHDNRKAIEIVQTPAGSLALCAAVVVVIAASQQLSMAALGLVAVTLFVMVVFPSRGLTILAGSSAFYFAVRPFRIDGWAELLKTQSGVMPFGGALGLQLVCVSIVLVGAAGFLTLQKKRPILIVGKRPVLSMILGWFGVLALSMSAQPGSTSHALLWGVTGVWVSSIWILAYSAVDAKGKDVTSLTTRAMFLRPFWGGSAAPIGKSFGFLNKFAATDAESLAVTRLKALKLSVWALILTGVLAACQYLAYDILQLQQLQTAIVAHADGRSFGNAVNVSSLVANYFIDLLIISVWGHFIVAIVRMAGYRIPRNTVNPLASRTLAEFWNRYFYYFKELLVDFFFYPAFTRFFKTNLKLRIAFATFCAAGLGNFLYHFMRETYVFAGGVSLEKLAIFQSAVFYSLALALGLIISQWRNKKVTPENGWLRYHVLPRVNVFVFFCFLKIFDDITGEGSLMQRMAFAFDLFGV